MNANTQPDYIALGMVAALLILVVILVIRKWLSNKAALRDAQTAPTEVAPPPVAEAPGTGGQVKLNGVHPRIAAQLMAGVAYQTGKPLNELRFISIQEVDE